MTKKPQVAVRAIVTNANEEILILKRTKTSYGNGFWNLPGGKIDFGDTAENTIKKELKEEVNLDCNAAQFLFYLDNLPDETTDLHFVTLFFRCKCSGDLQLNDESSEYVWINSNQLFDYHFVFDNDFAIKKFINQQY